MKVFVLILQSFESSRRGTTLGWEKETRYMVMDEYRQTYPIIAEYNRLLDEVEYRCDIPGYAIVHSSSPLDFVKGFNTLYKDESVIKNPFNIK